MIIVVVGVAMLVCLATGPAARAVQEAERAAGLDEGGLRRAAASAPLPHYPGASLERKSTGVAVVSVAFGADGRTRSVTVLQAPDPDIGDAVKAAIMRWTWTPIQIQGRPEPYGGRGKLTFYFRITGGKGRVVSPDLPPPPKPASRTGSPPVSSPTDHGSHGGPVSQITENELRKLTGAATPVLIDIGDRDAFRRGHRDGAINIPYDELQVRAPIELDSKKPHVIDCTQEERPRCNIALDILREKGFSQIALLVR